MVVGTVLTELQFLPSVYSMARLIGFDTVKLEQHENYNKGSFRNKCIVRSNQQNQFLVVPLKKGKNKSQSIREVKIAYEVDWIRAMENRLKTEYGKYPYFDYYVGDIMEIVNLRLENLFDLNVMFIEYIFHILDIKNYTFTNTYIPNTPQNDFDLRDTITPKFFNNKEYLLRPTQEGYFDFVPGHTILEPLFAYGPEVILLINQYNHRLINLKHQE